MAYHPGLLQHLRTWKGTLLERGMSILDLGAQQFDRAVTDQDVIDFVETFNPGGSASLAPGPYAIQFVAQVWQAAGFRYRSLDVYPGPDNTVLDLNHDDLPPEMVGKFDLVFNMGTTEHVANQANAFKVVHEALKVGGVAYHNCPFTGYANHGLVKYEPIFFLLLAAANYYEPLRCGLLPPHVFRPVEGDWAIWDPDEAVLEGTEPWQAAVQQDGLVDFLLRKARAVPYRVPVDLDTERITVHYPWLEENRELRALISQRYCMLQGQTKKSVFNYFKSLVGEWKKSGKRVVIYSAGQNVRKLLDFTPLKEAQVIGVSDRNPDLWGKSLAGYPIYPPDQIADLRPDVVLIGSVIHEQQISEQLHYLTDQGIELAVAHP